jgi:hypothetical protein
MKSKPEFYDQRRYWRKGFVRGLIVGVILMVLAVFMVAYTEHAFGQNTDEAFGEELKTILQSQILPEGYDKLPYIPYASLSGALWAYHEMPKPTYIIPKKMFFSMTNKEKDGKWITLYRIYFTPKPGTAYDVPKNKIVRNTEWYTNWSQR